MECPHYEWKTTGFFGTDSYYCDLLGDNVSQAKHDCYCKTDSCWSDCDIYKRYG